MANGVTGELIPVEYDLIPAEQEDLIPAEIIEEGPRATFPAETQFAVSKSGGYFQEAPLTNQPFNPSGLNELISHRIDALKDEVVIGIPAEYEQSKADLSMARQQFGDQPEKIQPFIDKFNLTAQKVGITPIGDPGIETFFQPLLPVSEAIESGEGFSKAYGVGPTTGKVMAGIAQGITSVGEFLSSPVGIATLGLGSAPVGVQKAVTAAFTAQMASHLPDMSTELGEAVGAGDLERAVRIATEGAGTLGFMAAGINVLRRPTLTVTAQVEALKASGSPETAKAIEEVSQRASKEPSATEVYGDVYSQPVEGLREMPAEVSGQRVQPQTEGGLQAPVSQRQIAREEVTPVEIQKEKGIEEEGVLTSEPEIVGLGGATPKEFELTRSQPTSIKNETVDAERQARGLPPAVQPAKRDFGKVWDEAMAKIDEDFTYADRLISELRDNPRALKDIEDATLLHRQIDLQNEHAKATRDLAQAVDDGRLEDAANEKARVEDLNNRLYDLYEINKKVGTETGRGLNARRMMAYEDFSLAKMQLDKRAANEGRPLTEEQISEIADLHKRIAEAQQRYDEYVSKSEDRIAELELQNSLGDIQAQAKKPRKPSEPKPEGDKIGARIKSKVEAGQESDISLDVQKLARMFVELGIKERDPLIDAVHSELQKYIPEITRRETMDAISGYGKYKQLSKDEISVQLRDLKGQMQQVGKLEDMQAGQAPAKTGVERRLPSDEERRLIKQVEEAKKKGGYQVTDPATQLRSALQSVKTRLENQIKDLEHEISTGEKIVKQKGETPTSPEIEALKARRDELKAEREEMFGKPELTDQQRVNIAMKSVDRSIAEYERRIKEKELVKPKSLSKTPVTPELEAARSRRDALKQELKEMQDLANPKKTPEEIALQSYKTRTKNRIAELQEKLAAGDFTPKPKRVLKLDSEATRLKFEVEKAKRDFNEGLFQDRMKNRPPVEKLLGGAQEVMNTSRAIITSLDLSAVLRQGGFITLGHPIRAAKSFPAMFKAMLSERGQHAVDTEILNRPNYPLYQQSKLYLSEKGHSLSKLEEAYMSRWADKIPIVAGSQRAYTTFLNKLRADSFDTMAKTLARNRELTPAEAKAIANYINVATGRGNFGMKENALVGLNTVFFAPRYVASRFQILAGQPLYRGTARTRMMIAKEYARFLTGVAMVYGLALWDGAEVESDPRSSDFGKLKYGDTRLDPLAGLQQVTVLTSRLASGETKSLKGKVTPIRGNVPFGGSSSFDVIARFLRTKLSPAVGAAVDILTGENVVREPVDAKSVAAGLLIPISLQDIAKVMEEQGVPRGTIFELLNAFGMGLQSFDQQQSK